ncbi:MAG: hypothetical protein WC375_02775 [Methanomassiliicoccales archaeon]
MRDAFAKFSVWRNREEKEDDAPLGVWLNDLFDTFLEYGGSNWQKGPSVSERFKLCTAYGDLRPNRVLLWQGSEAFPKLLLKIDGDAKNVGMGRGRSEYSKFIDLLRGTKIPMGIITNGMQFRLVYVGSDYDCWVEWDASRWFEDAEGRMQLAGFQSLCGPFGTYKRDGVEYPLLQGVQDSRSKQGELSQVLGENTRLAVEELLSSLDRSMKANPDMLRILISDPVTGKDISEEEQLEALYQSSIRVIMRIVVVLFAESRDLLPKSIEAYHSSYGAEGLYAQLKKADSSGGSGALEEAYHSWPRLLSLFRLIHEGSSDSTFNITSYGGGLFRKGDVKSKDAVLRALAVFEDERNEVTDATVLKILNLLKKGDVRVKVGRTYKNVSGLVDFSDLRTEYIGMMYEGLLDYKLRKVSLEQEAIVFLNIGQQPALPFSLLKSLDPERLKDLIQKLGKDNSTLKNDDEDEAEDEEEPASEPVEQTETANEEDEPVEEGLPDETASTAVHQWALQVVEISSLVKRPKGKNANLFRYEKDKEAKARQLILRVVESGETYLIRGSGTRKGTGTFYTRPQLAVPTVMRTLEPLVYDVVEQDDKKITIPKKPEDILAIKVCDPAMGSGSFLVASLNYITEALYRSLWHWKKVEERPQNSTAIVLPLGTESKAAIHEDIVPCRSDDDSFEPRVKARLKRYVVERCIYGVDINHLAVDLAKLSLWVETMDRELPFGFLDHKLKCGNSLVGCWFDRFQEYPLLAWKREGGDKDHVGTHHEKGKWTKEIKRQLSEVVKVEMAQALTGQRTLDSWEFADDQKGVSTMSRSVGLFDELHQLPLFGDGFAQREEFYRTMVENDPVRMALKRRFDLWCGVWFWPGEWFDGAPTPKLFYSPTNELISRSEDLAIRFGFFHWELEFPDVFVSGRGGFDAVVGNPPWEISKPNSKEFFTRYDPIYRTYGKQDAASVQKELFKRSEEIEKAWVDYNSTFNAMTNWCGNAAMPFGDPESEGEGGEKLPLRSGKGKDDLHAAWRRRRERHISYADKGHPFIHQGSADINTYKLFLELGRNLCRENGRLGMIVPSGIYTDNGTKALRELFIDHSKWEWIFCFENKKKIFQIHPSFKFGPVIVQKGGRTDKIHTAFMRHYLADWEEPNKVSIDYGMEQIEKFSPKSKSILEIRTKRDLEILTKIYANSVLLGDQSEKGWGIKYAREFDMTNDSHLFPPRTWWEDLGYRPDQYGRWLPPEGKKPELLFKGKEMGPAGDIALPLLEGRMIDQYDFCSKGWVSGKGRTAIWDENPLYSKSFKPQYLIASSTYKKWESSINQLKVGYMAISSATNSRSMYSSLIPNLPCGNSIAILGNAEKEDYCSISEIVGVFNSFTFDFALRCRLGGINLNYFIVEETPTIRIKDRAVRSKIIQYILSLNANSNIFSQYWLIYKNNKNNLRKLWAQTPYERLRIRCIIESVLAYYYGLSYEDLAWILRDDENNPKGFYRIDKNKDVQIKTQTLILCAYNQLIENGIESFIELNDGDGWTIPDSIRFSINNNRIIDFNDVCGHDYEVASRLGPRFLPWQLEGTPEESWKECEMHARNILGEEGFKQFMQELENPSSKNEKSPSVKDVLELVANKKTTPDKIDSSQKNLFEY